jgi:hypothetical protein
MNKAFYYYSVAAGILFVALGCYVAFFDQMLKANLGTTKSYVLAAIMVAYGLFRIWRATKMNTTNNNE